MVNYLNSTAILLKGGFIQTEDGSKMAPVEQEALWWRAFCVPSPSQGHLGIKEWADSRISLYSQTSFCWVT